MKKTLGAVAIAVAFLTLLSLVLDLPQKLGTAYRSLTRTAPTINLIALDVHQETITLDLITDDKTRGYSRFVWPAVYELHNLSNQDVTITNIENLLNEVEVGTHKLHLKQLKKKDSVIVLYDSFQSLTSKGERGVAERLPYTIKAGTKLYLKMLSAYRIEDNGQLLFCKTEPNCYRLLVLALGARPKTDGTLPCVLKTFQTKIDFAQYKSVTTEQKAILLVPGCKIDFGPIMDMLAPKKK